MIRYYNNDIKQPTAEWIDYNLYKSTDIKERFVFRNRLDRNANAKIGEIAGSYSIRNKYGDIRYVMMFDKVKYSNAAKLLWILENDKPWPTDDNGKHLVVDHIDGNPQNNFISNIRPATWHQNGINKRSHKNSTSQHRGVSWDSRVGKWASQIGYNGKITRIGFFDNEQDAALAYKNKAKELYGNL